MGVNYGRRWKKIRLQQLQKEPLCAMCRQQGKLTPATIADHIEPHKFDAEKFYLGKLQSLCKRHHDSDKKRAEIFARVGYRIGADGWPVDPDHPVYRTGGKHDDGRSDPV
jgi:5-methylcytosine-specific restriction enzyme A